MWEKISVTLKAEVVVPPEIRDGTDAELCNFVTKHQDNHCIVNVKEVNRK